MKLTNQCEKGVMGWGEQVVALGGANYRRNVAILDDDGRKVPGTKGYNCAGSSPTKHLFAF
jgi:Isy1-like splicing family